MIDALLEEGLEPDGLGSKPGSTIPLCDLGKFLNFTAIKQILLKYPARRGARTCGS